MPQPKGKTGNPNGRPTGSRNKAGRDLRQWVTDFISNHTSQFEADFLKLDAKDRITAFDKMLRYVLPTLQSTNMKVDFEKLSDQQLDTIISELTKNACK